MVVLVVSGFYARDYIYVGGQEKAEREKAAKKLFDFSEEELEKISVSAGGERFVLEKRESGWMIVSPIESAVDSGQLNAFIDTVTKGKVLDTVGGESDFARFGLDPAGWEIEFHTAGSGLHKLSVGSVSPSGEATYVTSSRHSGVVTVRRGFENHVEKSLFDLRNKRLFDGGSEGIVKVEFNRRATRFAAKRKNGGWQIVEPINAMADAQKIDELIRKTFYARASSFADGRVEESETRLKAPYAVIRMWRTGDDEPLSLSIGAASSDGAGFWVKASRGDTLAIVDKSFWNLVSLDVDGFLEKRLFPVAEKQWAAVTRLTVERKGVTVTVARSGEGVWEGVQPTGFKPDAGKIEEFFAELAGLRGFAFISKKEAPDEEAVLRIELENGGETHSALIYKNGTNGKIIGTSDFYKDALEFSINDFDLLDLRSSDLEDRRVFTVRAKDVGSISLKTEGTEYRFVKEKGLWKTVMPAGRKVDGFKLDALVRYLANSEYSGRLADAGITGAVVPIATVTLAGREGKDERLLSILGYNGDRSLLTARVEDKEELLLLSTTLLEVISRDELEELFQ